MKHLKLASEHFPANIATVIARILPQTTVETLVQDHFQAKQIDVHIVPSIDRKIKTVWNSYRKPVCNEHNKFTVCCTVFEEKSK